MATTIRLKRVGAKKQASYRIIVTDSREGSSGQSIERLGIYNPRTQPSLIRVNAARTLYWLNEGAEPSDTVRSLLQKTGLWKQFHDGVTAEQLDEEIVFLGPAEGDRATSQRPMPTDRAPKQQEVAAAAAAPAVEKAEERPAEAEAEAESMDEEPAEEPVAEAADESEEQAEEDEAASADAEADDEPVAEAAEAVEEVAEEAGGAEESEDEAEEAAADPVAEAEEATVDDAEESDDDAADEEDEEK